MCTALSVAIHTRTLLYRWMSRWLQSRLRLLNSIRGLICKISLHLTHEQLIKGPAQVIGHICFIQQFPNFDAELTYSLRLPYYNSKVRIGITARLHFLSRVWGISANYLRSQSEKLQDVLNKTCQRQYFPIVFQIATNPMSRGESP